MAGKHPQAKPKKEAKTTPLPRGSPDRRKYYSKAPAAFVQLTKGVMPKPGARTKRSYHVANRKRSANVRKADEPADAVSAEPLEDVFGNDDIPDFDADDA